MRLPKTALLAVLIAAPAAAGERFPEAATYDPGGRRDPFARHAAAPSSSRGFEMMALRGILRTARGYRALLVGPDGQATVVSAGQRLADGVVVAVDAASVTFRADESAAAREITKSLHDRR